MDVTGDTERALKNVRVGARFAGPGLVIAGSLLDLANGASPTKVGAETAATIAGSWLGATIGGLVPVPYLDIATAAAGSAVGGWLANWAVDKAF